MIGSQFVWLGDGDRHLDAPFVTNYKEITIGLYGGNTSSGANKNEDGVLVWRSEDNSCEFIAILDAHNTAQSAELVIRSLESIMPEIHEGLLTCTDYVFESIRELIVNLFSSDDFINKCKDIVGETSCLISVRKGQYLWWLNIGDCVLYLLHEELQKRGQFAMNQRNFYEWIGNQSTFNYGIPCYTTGLRELRPGKNMILMTTDGLLEYGECHYNNPINIYECLKSQFESSLDKCVQELLTDVHVGKGKDSATIISWTIENNSTACYPSD
ncbi:protein phosphatase 2C domain-containing protein [Paenibacillus sp. PAMC21692]|uniref:protein phosphatase 2C domain-containing protein n=1 Tax=Paenibacillus sp. PAMC21692 TaxID=2762320 RepID=UPI00164D9D84|nr:protein phosphatase 2C domain-containing protein [Paenibacillus sp. PAMC21692]QNK54968.1 protein phosphatase 2C domain-containing protein [Paenibacillus sp. PAMC21692]